MMETARARVEEAAMGWFVAARLAVALPLATAAPVRAAMPLPVSIRSRRDRGVLR
jgi:hypothetical protein